MELTPDFMEAEEESELAPESVAPESELAPKPPQHVRYLQRHRLLLLVALLECSGQAMHRLLLLVEHSGRSRPF